MARQTAANRLTNIQHGEFSLIENIDYIYSHNLLCVKRINCTLKKEGIFMLPNRRWIILFFIIYSIRHTTINTTPTHVYVNNCTSLRFEVSIEYEGPYNIDTTFSNNSQLVLPYHIPDEKSLLLAVNRLMPQGEHIYSIKLTHETNILYLKQKFISTNPDIKSDFGVSLASEHLQDPWFMNSQAKEKHERLLFINGHTIIVRYYAYDNDNNEDIEYTFYEKSSTTAETPDKTHTRSKNIAYSLTIPIASATHKYNQINIIGNTACDNIKSLKDTHTSYTKIPASRFTRIIKNNNTYNEMPQEGTNIETLMKLTTLQESSSLQEQQESSLALPQHNSIGHWRGMINYIAQRDSWHSGYATTDTENYRETHYWIQ